MYVFLFRGAKCVRKGMKTAAPDLSFQQSDIPFSHLSA